MHKIYNPKNAKLLSQYKFRYKNQFCQVPLIKHVMLNPLIKSHKKDSTSLPSSKQLL